MRTIWHSLAWKELHEHKWKLAAMLAILSSVTSLALLLERTPDRFGLAIGMILVCMIPLAVFVGLATAANERSRGTLPFLQSLPVPMWQVALAKLVMGLATIIVPIALTVLLLYGWSLVFDALGIVQLPASRMIEDLDPPPITSGSRYLDVIFYIAAIAASLFVWTAAPGVNRRDEVSAGVVALAVIAGCWVLGWLVVAAAGNSWLSGPVQVLLVSLAPGGIALTGDLSREHENPYILLCLFIAAIGHVILATRYIRHFGQMTNVEIHSPRFSLIAAGRPDWLSPPRRSPLTAIAWKQFRESGSITLIGLGGAVAIGIVGALAATTTSDVRPSRAFFLGTFAAGVYFGAITALVVGIGVVLRDLSPAIQTFWRSRPISPDQWFWTQFCTGLAVVVLAFQLPMIALHTTSSYDLSRVDFFEPEHFMRMQLYATLVAASVFAAAVMVTCLVRHAVYAAILTVAVLCIGILLGELALRSAVLAGLVEWNGDLPNFEDIQVITVGLAIGFVFSTILAWLAMRNDWDGRAGIDSVVPDQSIG